MIFRQLFDCVSCTYTYLIASRPGGEALVIDPVMENVDRYLKLLEELDLALVKAVDTHMHADHITGLGKLRDRTSCITVMGAAADVGWRGAERCGGGRGGSGGRGRRAWKKQGVEEAGPGRTEGHPPEGVPRRGFPGGGTLTGTSTSTNTNTSTST